MIRRAGKAGKRMKISNESNPVQKLPFGVLKSVLFRVALLLENEQRASRSPHLSTQLVYFTFSSVYTALCLSLYTNVTHSANEWSQFWTALAWTRLDFICWKGGKEVIFVAWGVVWIHTAALLTLFWQNYSRNPCISPSFVSLLPLFKWKTLTLLDVPLSALLLSHSFLPTGRISPLYGAIAVDIDWISPVSIASFIGLCGLMCFRELVFTQNDHSKAKSDVYARATCGIDCLRCLLTHVIAGSYFLIGEESPVVHLLVVIAVALGVVACYYVRIPYYNGKANEVVVWSFGFVAASAAVGLWTEIIGSGLFSALGTVAIAPAFACVLCCHYRNHCISQLSYYQQKLPVRTLRLPQVELALRSDLCGASHLFESEEDKRGLVTRLLTVFRTQGWRKEVIAWVVDFAISELRDLELGRVKLALVMDVEDTFESDYHSFKHHCYLSAQPASPSLEYLQYLHHFLAVKQLDKSLCLHMLPFLKLLIQKTKDSARLSYSAGVIITQIRRLKNEYKDLTRAYPNAKEAAYMFASFLQEILHLDVKANTVRIRAGTMSYDESRHVVFADHDSNVTFFQQGSCIIIAEGSKSAFGCITHANDLAHLALGYEPGTLFGVSINNLVPRLFRKGHLERLKDFLENGKSVEIGHQSLLYLNTFNSYILECVVSLSLTALSSPPQILLAFKPCSSYKHTALFASSFCIESCTRGFLASAGLANHPQPYSTPLKDLLPYLWSAKWRYGLKRYFRVKSRLRLFALFSECLIGTTTTLVLNLFDTEKEAKRWLKVVKGEKDEEIWDGDIGYERTITGTQSEKWGQSEVSEASAAYMIKSQECISVASNARQKKGSVQFSAISWPDPPSQCHSRGSILSGYPSVLPSIATSTSSTFNKTHSNRKLISQMMGQFRMLRLVTVLAMAVLVSGSIIIGNLVNSAVREVVALDRTEDYIMRSLHVLRIAQNARYIDLANILDSTKFTISSFKSVLQSSSISLNSIQKSLLSDPSCQDLTEEVVIWELLDGEATMRTVNLFQAVETLSSQADIIADITTDRGNFNNQEMFYVYRNGLGETWKAVNKAVWRYIERTKEVIRTATKQTFAYFLPFILVLAVTSGISFYFLYQIQAKVSVVSSLLTSLPTEFYLESKQQILDRLKRVHSETDSGIKFESLLGNPHATASCGTYRSGTMLIGLLFVLSMVWYAVEYFVIIGDIAETLLTWPEAVSLTVARITDMSALWSWLIESIYYTDPSLSLTSLPGALTFGHPRLVFLTLASDFHSLSSDMFQQELSGRLHLSSQHLSELYVRTNFTCRYLQRGFNSGLKVLQRDFEDMLEDPIAAAALSQDYYRCTEEIMDAAQYVHSIYDVEIGKVLYGQMSLLIGFIVVHSIVNLVGMGLGVYWAIRKTDGQVKAMWKTLELFPQESEITCISHIPTFSEPHPPRSPRAKLSP